jgi:hypothetical protein
MSSSFQNKSFLSLGISFHNDFGSGLTTKEISFSLLAEVSDSPSILKSSLILAQAYIT